MLKRALLAALPLLILLAVPVLLRPKDAPLLSGGDRLVILTPHAEAVRSEFATAFRRHYQARHGRDITLDFRNMGGTSDIVRYIADRYEAEFRRFWTAAHPDTPWSSTIAAAFSNHRVDPERESDPLRRLARQEFLASDCGIGVDIFWGGGTYDHNKQARRGFGVDAGTQRRHPEWFTDAVIPAAFGGEPFYDPAGRYYGVCLASFGICANPDRIGEMGCAEPRSWHDLGKADFFNTLVIADPTKSGSANKCFESILQQCMNEAVLRYGETRGPAIGWQDGFNLIKRIVANARTMTDSASKVPRDIAAGNAAAGMAIDTYGLSEQDWSELIFDGTPHIRYYPPLGGTAVSADPVQLLRGAPNRQAAEDFIDFLLSVEGQLLWNTRPGLPGGPVKHALRRPPIRRDLYQPRYTANFTDPDYNPYIAGAGFTYRAEWTSPYFGLIRVMIRCLALDVQQEMRTAWRAILDAGGPERVLQAAAAFDEIPIPYQEAGAAAESLNVTATRTMLDVIDIQRSWSEKAVEQYRRAARLAQENK